jgi:hypothetical protein
VPPPRTPVGSRSGRYLAILVGVVVGYVVGLMLEERLGWANARILAMAVGGVIAGVGARFTFFRDPRDA